MAEVREVAAASVAAGAVAAAQAEVWEPEGASGSE